MKSHAHGLELGRRESPRADIRRGPRCKLSHASGRLPDAPWGRFKSILIDFGSKRGRQNLPENLPGKNGCFLLLFCVIW